MPEPDEGKLSSPVLRGVGSREAPLLPGTTRKKEMKLSSLLRELRSHQHKREEYDVFAIRLAEGQKEGPDADYDEFPIFEIDIESEDKEITFLTNRLSKETTTDKKAIKVKELVAQLSGIETECADYALFSGSAVVEMGEGYYGRVDTPICASGWNDDDKHFAILEQTENDTPKTEKKWWQFWKR